MIKPSVILLMALPFAAVASPFLVSAPTNEPVTHCAVYLDGERAESPVAKDYSGSYCKHDLAGAKPGGHTATAAFVNKSEIWGDIEGDKSAPFVFDSPGQPAAPSGMRVVR